MKFELRGMGRDWVKRELYWNPVYVWICTVGWGSGLNPTVVLLSFELRALEVFFWWEEKFVGFLNFSGRMGIR